jgi:hypothetical protein
MELKEGDGEEQLRNENRNEKWTKLGETSNNWIEKTKSDFDKIEKVEDETLDHGIDEGKDTSDGIELEQEVGDAIEGKGEKNEKEGLRKKRNEVKRQQGDSGVLYSVEDNPPWHLCILLGFQVIVLRIGCKKCSFWYDRYDLYIIHVKMVSLRTTAKACHVFFAGTKGNK